MRQTGRTLGRVVLAIGLVAALFVPRRAWAPPICAATIYHTEKLTLSLREATLDGAPATLPPPTSDYFVTSNCNENAVASSLADPNLTNPRQSVWIPKP